jgi:hypothetical protein
MSFEFVIDGKIREKRVIEEIDSVKEGVIQTFQLL